MPLSFGMGVVVTTETDLRSHNLNVSRKVDQKSDVGQESSTPSESEFTGVRKEISSVAEMAFDGQMCCFEILGIIAFLTADNLAQ